MKYTYILAAMCITSLSLITHNNPTIQTSHLNRQLIQAIENNSIQEVERILNQHPDINARSEDNKTPLMIACRCGFKQTLLHKDTPGCCHEDCGDNPPDWKKHYTILNHNRCLIITLLINANADIHLRDSEGYTALHYACILTSDLERVSILLAAGANPNTQNAMGRTTIMEAIADANIELAHILLQAGARVDIPDNNGITALQMAFSHAYYFQKMADLIQSYATKENKNAL
jgi:uncharacterized protein